MGGGGAVPPDMVFFFLPSWLRGHLPRLAEALHRGCSGSSSQKRLGEKKAVGGGGVGGTPVLFIANAIIEALKSKK